jgi:hypothetical protein
MAHSDHDTNERRRSTDFDLGRLEGKMDALLTLAEEHKVSISLVNTRVTSLETSRTQYRTYFRMITYASGVLAFILGKILFFTHRVQINVPIVPVK